MTVSEFYEYVDRNINQKSHVLAGLNGDISYAAPLADELMVFAPKDADRAVVVKKFEKAIRDYQE